MLVLKEEVPKELIDCNPLVVAWKKEGNIYMIEDELKVSSSSFS